jgi:hypothetical protein
MDLSLKCVRRKCVQTRDDALVAGWATFPLYHTVRRTQFQSRTAGRQVPGKRQENLFLAPQAGAQRREAPIDFHAKKRLSIIVESRIDKDRSRTALTAAAGLR